MISKSWEKRFSGDYGFNFKETVVIGRVCSRFGGQRRSALLYNRLTGTCSIVNADIKTKSDKDAQTVAAGSRMHLV